jgi:penicillin-binding protein 1C
VNGPKALIRPSGPPSPAKPVEDGRPADALCGRGVGGEGQPHALERRVFAIVGALVFVFSLALPGAWSAYLDHLGPLDLAASRVGSTIVVDREGRLLRAFTLPDGRWRLPVGVGEVDPRYLAMLLAYEDGRFYTHGGVDLRAMARAAGQWIARGHVVSGGSTLTMQLARLIEPRDDRTLAAKLRQVARAWQIERRLAKSGILERYLALAPFGGNLEGVRAASLAYFGKEPRKLTIGEAALLVALPRRL